MGSVCHRYMCILLYVMLIRCNGVVGIYPHLELVWSLCHEYMCSLLYVKLIGCNFVAGIYSQLEEGEWDHSGMGYICILLYVKLIWCKVLHRSMVNCRRRTGQN